MPDLTKMAELIDYVVAQRMKLSETAKVLRLKRWREKVAHSLQNACRWARGEQIQLTHLDSPQGLAVHPQDLVDEVKRRSCEQFEYRPDEHKRAQFMKELSASIQHHSVAIPPIEPSCLRKYVLRKRSGAVGADGWHADELKLLPNAAWQLLTEICTMAETTGEWPRALTCSLTVGLRKPGPASKGIRLRLLRIMSRIMRGWASMRCADLKLWIQDWTPKELYGGIPQKGTDTASAPVAVAMTEAILKNKPKIGASLDYTACFDKIDPFLAILVLEALGLPPPLCRALRGLYKSIRCICRVGPAATSAFSAFIGIIQGCAFSCILLNGLMATWVWAVHRHLGEEYVRIHEVLFSVYLDDRNLLANTTEAMQKIFTFGDYFDGLINSELNESKCQIYSSPVVSIETYKDVLPQAERTDRPWSLGFTLPARGIAAGDKAQARTEKAVESAKKLSVLPHDIRVQTIVAVFPSQLSYGNEYTLPDDASIRALKKALEQALWGTARRARSSSIMWTVLYPGHAVLPEQVTAMRCVRFLRTVAHKTEPNTKNIFVELWTSDSNESNHATPIQAAQVAFARQGWKWIAPFCLLIEGKNGNIRIDIENDEWQAAAHGLREACRWKLLQDPKLHERWDLRGTENGIDYNQSRQLLCSSQLSFLQKGYLRTLLTGAVWTPSRMLAAKRLTEEEACCIHCSSGEVESLGHRFWKCPRWAAIRQALNLADFDEETWPRCLTRCGVVPSGCALRFSQTKSIHTMMVKITATEAECPHAQHQHQLAARCDTGRTRRNHAYRDLQDHLGGDTHEL